MREITDEDIKPIEEKIGKLSHQMLFGKTTTAQELAKLVEKEFATDEDKVFALTLLIINRYLKTTNEVLNKIRDENKNELMFG